MTTRVQRLAGLCKVWGAAKFFHPWIAYREIDWDAALVSAIPLVNAATSAAEYAKAVDHLLSALHDPASHVLADGEQAASDLSLETAPPEGEPELHWDEGMAALRARDLTRLPMGPELFSAIQRLTTEMEGADSIVVDLRGAANYVVMMQMEALAPRLLGGQALHPSVRRRMHSGYTTDGHGSGGYSSGFYVTDSLVIDGTGGPLADKPLVIVCDKSVGALDWVIALQAAGRARVVYAGDPGTIAPGELVELPDEVRVWLRTGEQLFADATVGFVPDCTVEPAEEGEAGYFESSVMKEVTRVLGGEVERPIRPTLETLVNPYLRERRYEDMPFPSVEYRLLALFRYWTVMNLFFPYKQHLDQPWDEVLLEAIAPIEEAKDETEYALALASANAKSTDTHCFLYSPAFQRWVGTHAPPMIVRLIEGRSVVTHIAEPIDGLAVGDVVLSVDGVATEARRDRLRPYIAASTSQAMEWRLHNALLNGEEGSKALLEVERSDGSVEKVEVERTRPYVPAPDREQPAFGVLESGLGYMDLARLMPHEVDEAFEAVRDTPGLILDDRCYPNGTAWAIAPRLTDRSFVGALFARPEPRSPSPDMVTGLQMKQTLPKSDKWTYRNPVVVIINGEAISQAEHTCLLIDAACKPTFVGSATNGANGDVTSIQLPGGVRTMFSGHDVRHADGRQLQRVGILPDVEVHPTIDGLRAGRDEVLEAAVGVLTKQTG